MKKLKNEIFATVVIVGLIVLSLFYDAFGQSTSQRLYQSCAGTLTKAEIKINKGFIDLIPCPTKNVRVNGSTIAITGLATLNGLVGASQTFAVGSADTAAFSSAGTTHTLNLPISAVSGSSRTSFFPYFSAANTLAKSPFSFDGTQVFGFQNSTLNADFRAEFKSSATNNGYIQIGDFTGTNYLRIDDTDQNLLIGDLAEFNSSNFKVRLGSSSRSYQVLLDNTDNTVKLGDVTSVGNGTILKVDDDNSRLTFNSNNVVLIADGAEGVANFQQGDLQLQNGRFYLTTPQTPASASAACTIGQIAWDTNFVYICIATNTWKRSAISTW